MPRGFQQPGVAKKAGQKGSPKGTIQQKTKDWEKLKTFMLEAGAKRVEKMLLSETDDDKFFQRYERLLNYFKPKQATNQITGSLDTESTIIVKDKKTADFLNKIKDGS